MGLFRATIQHRRGVRLLVSGAAPFDELDGVWDDHFISARQIKLPFLNLPDSVGLLTQPSPEFPRGSIPEEAAHKVYERTGGQPFLLQVYGSLLVSRLNDEKRKVATIDDVSAIELRAIEWAEPYFRDAFRYAPATVREALDYWETVLWSALDKHAVVVRGVGEMASEREGFISEKEMLTYEALVNMTIKRFPCVVICQYDVRKFSGQAVLEALRAHPDVMSFPLGPLLK